MTNLTQTKSRAELVLLIAELISHQLTYRDLAYFNGDDNTDRVRAYGTGRSFPPSKNLLRLELVRDLSRAVIAALGALYQPGHVQMYFCTRQKNLGNITPGYHIRLRGAARQFDLRSTPSKFAQATLPLESR